MQAQETERLWEAEDVAALLRVSVRTVQRLTQSGRLPFLYVGKQVRYDKVEVLAYLKAKRDGA